MATKRKSEPEPSLAQPVTPCASTVPKQYQRCVHIDLCGDLKLDELWITGPVDGIPNKNNTTTDNYNYNNNGLTKHVRGLRMYQ
jgi:hypothetical protein